MLSEDDQVHVLQNYRGGTYRGQLRGGKPHGHGSWEGKGVNIGHRYDGEWADGEMTRGRGAIVYPSGARYEGEFRGCFDFHGCGLFVLADGIRQLDGEWKDGHPLSGTMVLDATGTAYRATFDGRTPLRGDGSNWGDAPRMLTPLRPHQAPPVSPAPAPRIR